MKFSQSNSNDRQLSVKGSALSVERSGAADPSSASIDAANPWPGLATFTEDQGAYFHGRDDEIDDLTQLARLRALVVLFGQSGLGKSSLLQAGVFPRLRAAGFCPIYIRLDHAESAPSPTEQIRSLLLSETAKVGTWTKPGAAKPGETLWELFHHRDDRLIGPGGRPIIPVLVFDQFEELFTLGAAAGGRRERAVAFISELAELVENRPSEQLVARLEASADELETFDFSRADYRVVITLREDFLPELEGLKTIMPAMMANRMRLARMTGTQALQAVIKPGAALVTEEVACKIVEFVAGARGGSIERLAELNVEPALLSVVCRELNERRKALGHALITADLVTGNRREILTDFYERSVADLPAGMRTFVEDHLLTKSGFRDNLALETALEFPDVTRPLIDTLVTRRLLRLEDRLGVQRVELTHDVLAEVIRAARDARQQRLALAAAEEQRRVELAAAARRTRRLRWALAGAIAAVIALSIGAVFGIRAQRQAAAQVGRADLFTGSRLLDEGNVGDGLAYLVSAARREHGTHIAAPRILTTLAFRSFLLPTGAPLQLPAAPDSALFLADGRSVLVQDVDGRIRLIDATEGKIVREYQFDHKVQPKGLRIAARNPALFAVALANGTVVVCDTTTGRPRFAPVVVPAESPTAPTARATPATGALPTSFSLSPDGRWIALFLASNYISSVKGAIPRTTVIIDAASGVERARIDGFNYNYHDRPSFSPFSPDGSRLVTSLAEYSSEQVSNESLIKMTTEVRSLPDGKVVAALADEPRVTLYFTEFSADGSRVLTRTYRHGEGGYFIRVFDAGTGTPIGPAVNAQRSRSSLFDAWLTPDGTRMVHVASDRNVYVHDAVTGQPVFPGLPHGGPAFGLGLSADGVVFATASVDGLYRLWDLRTGALRAVSSFKLDRRDNIAFADDGRSHLIISESGLARNLRLTHGAAAPLVLPRTATSPTLLHFAPKPPARLEWFTPTRARIFDVASGRFTEAGFTLPVETMGFVRFRMGVPLQPGQSLIARRDPAGPRAWTMGENGVARDVTFSDPLPPLPTGSAGAVISASTRFAASMFAPAAEPSGLYIWDLRTGQRVGRIPRANRPRRVEFGNDDRWLATFEGAADGGGINIYEISTAKLLLAISPEPRAPFSTFRFSRDGTRVITGDAWGTVQFWDSSSGRLLQSVQAHSFGVTSFTFSDDDKYFASLSADGSVQVWESARYTTVGAPRMHSGASDNAFFNLDGGRISTTTGDGKVRVWDVRSGVPLNDALEHDSFRVSVASFSPDDRFVTTRAGGGTDSPTDTQRLWAAPPPSRSGSVPKWLLQLATICAGRRVNDEGKIISAVEEFERIDDLRREIAGLPADDIYAEWARWFLSDSPTRSIAPGFTVTPAAAKALFDEMSAAKSAEAAAAAAAAPARKQPANPKGKKGAAKN